ncbi:MAG: hypothetical protein CVT94_17615 [Bacteroidetes bacterium HGW-Bacteroidetes-11]|jgi:hypothetical protein|nr:MAG: hypothetical protein CVT94_17615 [Bacteroidetes bacterium HGW-Bacteroidetes-11]
MGNPIVGMSPAADNFKGRLSLNLYYKQGFNETYFRNNVKLVNYGIYNYSGYDFAGLSLSYGVNSRLLIEHETGYYPRKEVNFADTDLEARAKDGFGLSNGLVSFRYSIIQPNDKKAGVMLGAGVKYPFKTEKLSLANVELPMELQPSTNAWGLIGQFFITKETAFRQTFSFAHRSEINFRNKYNYKYGSLHTTAFTMSGKIYRGFYSAVTLRNEFKLSDDTKTGARLASQGSNVVIINPKIEYKLPGEFGLYIFGDLPVYKYYFGEQISMQYAFGIGLTKAFQLKKQIKPAAINTDS